MSSRARRVGSATALERFTWSGTAMSEPEALYGLPPAEPVVPAVDPAALERDAFAKGYAQGERAGTEAGNARAEAMLRRLAQTLDDLQGLRRDLIRRTEREVAELAVAIARRVVQRELALDQDLVLAMARVALDRLGDVSAATIRLHPDDYAAALAGRGGLPLSAPGVQILSDPAVQRGGCLVQSPFGSIDVGAATQIDELTHTLLGDDAHGDAVRPLGFRDDAAA